MSGKGGHTRKRPSTSLYGARATSPAFSRAEARCALFPNSILELPIEISDDSLTSSSSSKRRKVETSRPVSEWKPRSSGHKERSSTDRKEGRVLATKLDKNIPSVETELHARKPRTEKYSPGQHESTPQAKKFTQTASSHSSDLDQGKFDALIKQIQVQNLTIKGLETKMDKILSATQSDIAELLLRMRDQDVEAKAERRELLDQIRLMMAELLWISVRQTTGVNLQNPSLVIPTLPSIPETLVSAPVFKQPMAPPSISVSLETTFPQVPAFTADPPALVAGDQWAVNASFPAAFPIQQDSMEQSRLSSYSSEVDWYSAQDTPSDPETQFPAVDQQLAAIFSQMVENPDFSGYPSMLDNIHLRAYPKKRGPEGYWQTSADGINSYQVFQQPPQMPVQPGFMPDTGSMSTLSTRSLSTGVESLPSGCTRETSISATDAASTTGRSLRTRTNKPDYVGHPMDALKKPLQAVAQSEASEKGDKAGDSDDGRHIRGRSACLPEMHLKASNGIKNGTGATWPAHGQNTYGGRKQDVQCDHCKGRAHVACAGFDDQAELQRQPWSCPECTLSVESAEGETGPPISKSQEEMCLRPDCIVRTRKKLERRHRDEDEFYIERIVGRMRMTPAGRAKHQYEYLVKWTEYPIYECTWEPATNIKDLEYYKGYFTSQANLEHADLNRRVVMLQETEEYWDDKGQRDEERLEREGVERKEWWY